MAVYTATVYGLTLEVDADVSPPEADCNWPGDYTLNSVKLFSPVGNFQPDISELLNTHALGHIQEQVLEQFAEEPKGRHSR